MQHVVTHCREREKRDFPLAGFGIECLIESLCLGHLWMSEVGMKGSIYSPTVKGSGAIIRPCFVCVVKIFKVFFNRGYTVSGDSRVVVEGSYIILTYLSGECH